MTMTTYAILAVHLSRDGKRVEQVRWRQVDGASNRWSGELTEVDASDVADTLLRGDVVVTIFDHEGPQGARRECVLRGPCRWSRGHCYERSRELPGQDAFGLTALLATDYPLNCVTS